MSSPIISIIIPVYKVEEYLRQCLDSVLVQTFTDWELILVDDGSPDHCGAICDEYAEKDSRVKVLHIPNGGVSNARNIGMKEAQGEWITFIDSDDWVSEDFIESLYEPIRTNSDLDLVHGGCQNFEDKVGFSINQTYNFYIGNNPTHLLKSFRGLAVSKLYRRDIIEYNHIKYDKNIRIAEDYAFTLDYILFVHKYCFSSATGYFYRHTSNSATRNNIKKNETSTLAYIVHTATALSKYIENFDINEMDSSYRWNTISDVIFSTLRTNGFWNVSKSTSKVFCDTLKQFPILRHQEWKKRLYLLLFKVCHDLR